MNNQLEYLLWRQLILCRTQFTEVQNYRQKEKKSSMRNK